MMRHTSVGLFTVPIFFKIIFEQEGIEEFFYHGLAFFGEFSDTLEKLKKLSLPHTTSIQFLHSNN
jgi:hypothetical protein